MIQRISASGPMEGRKSVNRPLGISILALLIFLGAVIALVMGIFVYADRVQFLQVLQNELQTAGLGPVTADFVLNFSLILIGYGVVHIAIAVGLWQGMNWARLVSMLLSLLGLLFFLPSLLEGAIIGIPVIIFAVLVLYYFTRQSVKEYFKT